MVARLAQVADRPAGLDRVEIEVDVEVLARAGDPAVAEQHRVLSVAVGDVREGRERRRTRRAGAVAAQEHRPIAEEVLGPRVRLDLDVAVVQPVGSRRDLADLLEVEGGARARCHHRNPE